jgi:hypothetical protein
MQHGRGATFAERSRGADAAGYQNITRRSRPKESYHVITPRSETQHVDCGGRLPESLAIEPDAHGCDPVAASFPLMTPQACRHLIQLRGYVPREMLAEIEVAMPHDATRAGFLEQCVDHLIT